MVLTLFDALQAKRPNSAVGKTRINTLTVKLLRMDRWNARDIFVHLCDDTALDLPPLLFSLEKNGKERQSTNRQHHRVTNEPAHRDEPRRRC